MCTVTYPTSISWNKTPFVSAEPVLSRVQVLAIRACTGISLRRTGEALERVMMQGRQLRVRVMVTAKRLDTSTVLFYATRKLKHVKT